MSIQLSIFMEFVIDLQSIINSDGIRNLFVINYRFHMEFLIYFEYISNTSFEFVNYISILPEICNLHRTNY